MKRTVIKQSTVTSVVSAGPRGGWNVVADGKAATLRSSAKSKAVIAKSTKKYGDVLKRLARS